MNGWLTLFGMPWSEMLLYSMAARRPKTRGNSRPDKSVANGGAGQRRDSVQRYSTLREIRQALSELDSETSLTVVLVLDDAFAGHLPSLIARNRTTAAGRLVLVAQSGRLPGLETIGDLAATGNALGWQEIVFELNACRAMEDARGTLRAEERFAVLAPSWHADCAAGRA